VKTIRTETVIAAPVDVVWAVITDLPSYGEWNPFITAISGDLEVGRRLRVTFSLPGQRDRTFTPSVTAYEPGRRLTWFGRLFIPKLFDGEHTLAVEPEGDGTRFTHSERFMGLLPPLMGKLLAATHEGFTAMDRALAERATAR
jgi:hypothetical protein